MTTVAEVKLWGQRIGAVSLEENKRIASFQYDPDFAESNIEISPFVMPLSKRIFFFPELPYASFHGLPGLLSDSLPDKFGNELINVWLARQGRSADSFNAVERLCYTGERGMGALEYLPVIGTKLNRSKELQIEALVELASDILSNRNSFNLDFSKGEKEEVVQDILQVGTSAGGARAKAVIAWNEESGKIRSGQIDAGEGFKYWLIKFDGVNGNRDKELDDSEGFGVIEFAYYKMALKAGITMNRCRIFEENNRHHFMTLRFDRTDSGKKLHMQSLGSIAHFDFNAPGAYSYEQAFYIIRQLDLPVESIEEQFRRMTFNIIARNQDDHVKNIAFLMDKSGTWSLAPAFDVTYSYNPDGEWTSAHQMSMNSKRDHFTLKDFRVCAKNVIMKRGRAEAIIEQVSEAVKFWPEIAVDVKIPDDTISRIMDSFRSIL